MLHLNVLSIASIGCYSMPCNFSANRTSKPIQEAKHLIIQLTHNIQYVDKIKIIKYLKVLQHVSDHRGSIIRGPCTVLS